MFLSAFWCNEVGWTRSKNKGEVLIQQLWATVWLVSNSAFGNACFRWYFAVISMSGVFAVTFSVIFAYVADITQEHERSTAYGLVRS